jgi:hypothetical protein
VLSHGPKRARVLAVGPSFLVPACKYW